MLDNLAFSSLLAKFSHIVVSVSSNNHRKLVFSYCSNWVNILNAELSKTELWHEVVGQERLEEAEHRFWVVGESVLAIASICFYYIGFSKPDNWHVSSFCAGSEMEIFMYTENVDGALVWRAS